MESSVGIEKTIALFSYIKELATSKYRVVTNIDRQVWHQYVKDIPSSDDVYCYSSGSEELFCDEGLVLLKVHKPADSEFTGCPEPPQELIQWLVPGWERYQGKCAHVEYIDRESSNNDVSIDGETRELFSDDETRIEQFNSWNEKRNKWAEDQKRVAAVRGLFVRLYELSKDLDRESETQELVIGNGIIQDIEDREINHPILIKRVRFYFDAEDNTIMIVDAETEPELYTMLIQRIESLDYSVISGEKEVLEESLYHPFDLEETPAYLRTLIHRLSPEGEYYTSIEEKTTSNEDPITVIWDPVFFVRRRIDGTIKAIDQILHQIELKSFIPNHILELVGEGKVEPPEEITEPVIEELLAQSCGESKSILLSKEANREQLEIAERIDKHNAVLVQGPPGTGKTHTIANLLGNFLAEGKSVLITSHTKKALSVLKDQVPKEIQNLCVSVLDDTKVDMEKSIDGISEYLSNTNSIALSKQAEDLQKRRDKIIEALAVTRRKTYQIKHKELDSVVYNGKSYSPLDMAKFVNENSDELGDTIPGRVGLGFPFPLTQDELISVYQLNHDITEEEERIIRGELPDLERIVSPKSLKEHLESRDECLKCIDSLSGVLNMRLVPDWTSGRIIGVNNGSTEVLLERADRDSLTEKFEIKEIDNHTEWQICAIVDGQRGGGYRDRWITLKEEVNNLKAFSDSIIRDLLGKSITFSTGLDAINESGLTKLKARFDAKGRVTKFDMFAHKDMAAAYETVLINGKPISSSEECKLCMDYYELLQRREKVRQLWNDLITGSGAIAFEALGDEPEISCQKILSNLDNLLDWYPSVYNVAKNYLSEAGYNTDILLETGDIADDKSKARADINAYSSIVPVAARTLLKFEKAWLGSCAVNNSVQYVESLPNSRESLMKNVVDNLLNGELEQYEKSYRDIEVCLNKQEAYTRRNTLLSKIKDVAPEWAKAIYYRQEPHANAEYPHNIEEAWKWKQFDSIISDLSKEPYDSLQKKSVSLSKELRRITTSLAATKAWYHLLRQVESHPDMKQALNGWKLTVKKIGKGTGKKAPMLKKQAREQMAVCQKAVPAWIMPMSKALESFDASNNQFDVVIIDEASQSDITSLAILYLAKKVIIVGDDKQVSPMAVGMDIDSVSNLMTVHLQGRIPNWHLYDPKTSLYDIAMTTYQPLMLREHFRCVPDIIGYSNKLSYDFKIKPLRDASSSSLLPAIVPFRVNNGHREGQSKTNYREAITIVALLKACLELPEYQGQTFGVISLLGDDQAKLIEREINKHIEPAIIEKRRILCGNASHFQGDERDVVFLSMVDSNDEDGPLKLVGEGAGQSTKQRYNVATSRARNQLWIVHSLDYNNDLKANDIRKDLLEYAHNPKAFEEKVVEIRSNADSPFETAVAAKLVAAGYHIVQQWPVGSYRIDMVAQYGRTRIAIECDGELFHSGEEKIREDMERQTILERLGWRFIRIRGSEFYRNPELTMNSVIKELAEYGVLPEEKESVQANTQESELLKKVKVRAHDILTGLSREMRNNQQDEEALLFAGEKTDNILSDQDSTNAASRLDVKPAAKQNGTDTRQVKQEAKPARHKGVNNSNRKRGTERIEKPETRIDVKKTLTDNSAEETYEQVTIGDLSSSSNYSGINFVDYISEYENARNEKKEEISIIDNSDGPDSHNSSSKMTTMETGLVIDEIEKHGFKCFDNSKSSGIIWAVLPTSCSESDRDIIEKLMQRAGLKFAYEPRGALATQGAPAYRIVTGKEFKNGKR